MSDLPAIPLEWLPEEMRHDVKFIGYLHPSRADVVDPDDPTTTRRLIEAMAMRLGLDVSVGVFARVCWPFGSLTVDLTVPIGSEATSTIRLHDGAYEAAPVHCPALADADGWTQNKTIWHAAHWVLDPANADALGVSA